MIATSIEILKNRKKELGWSNYRLSKESGIPVGTLNKIFNGSTRTPREKTLRSLVRAMGMEFYQLDPRIALARETPIYNPSGVGNLATISTYYSMPSEYRKELIDGKIFSLHAKSMVHQMVMHMLAASFYEYFERDYPEWRVFVHGCDVRLDSDDFTMVQPDIFVVHGQEKTANGNYCMGAPDFIAEIVSPEEMAHDYDLKRYKYQNAGVREYWIVDPEKRKIMTYAFVRDGVPSIYTFDDAVRPYLYPDLSVDFSKIKERLV